MKKIELILENGNGYDIDEDALIQPWGIGIERFIRIKDDKERYVNIRYVMEIREHKD